MSVQERRLHGRLPLDTPCRARDVHGNHIEGRVRDISRTGVYVETAEPFAPGVLCDLTIYIRSDSEFELTARAARRDAGGMGLEFTGLRHAGVRLLEEMLINLASTADVKKQEMRQPD